MKEQDVMSALAKHIEMRTAGAHLTNAVLEMETVESYESTLFRQFEIPRLTKKANMKNVAGSLNFSQRLEHDDMGWG
jgi:hypothetical protein